MARVLDEDCRHYHRVRSFGNDIFFECCYPDELKICCGIILMSRVKLSINEHWNQGEYQYQPLINEFIALKRGRQL